MVPCHEVLVSSQRADSDAVQRCEVMWQWPSWVECSHAERHNAYDSMDMPGLFTTLHRRTSRTDLARATVEVW